MSVPLIVCGAAGRMGRTLVGLIQAAEGAHLHAAVEVAGHPALGQDAGVLAGTGPAQVTLTDDYAHAAAPGTVTLDFTVAPAATRRCASAAGATVKSSVTVPGAAACA